MKNRSTLFLIFFSYGFLFNFLPAVAQTLQSTPVTIISNSQPRARVFSQGGLGKTSSCPVDTVNYTFNKSTAFQAVSLNTTNSGNIFAQWYPAPQSITVSGFDFYAWQSSGSAVVVSLNCRMYKAGPDSMPTGSPLASVSVLVDSTFGGGILAAFRKQAIFATPVTTSVPYVITVETSSSVNVSVVANSWNATPPNGRSEWLSSVKINNSFIRGYNVNIGGVQFNADFIFQPYVSYSLTAGFTPTACNAGGNSITFTNTSSPVLFSPFYSVRAFQAIPQFGTMWDYGDTSGTWYTVNGSRIYNYRRPYTVKLQDTLYGWLTGCGDRYSLTVDSSSKPSVAHNNGPLCNGATLKLTADTVPGATYYWTGPNGFTSTQQNPVITGANVSMIGNYSVVAITGQCSSLVALTYVNVISTPSASNSGPVCAGQTLNLSATNITGATYAWTGPNGFSSTQQSPTIPSATSADSGTYNVSVTLAGCGTLGPFSTTAVVNRVPGTPTVTNNGPLCAGDNLNLTATYFPAATYSWTGPNGFSSNQQNPSRSFVQSSYAGTYSVTINNNGCTSQPGSTTVIVNNVPSTPTAGSNAPLCTGQTLSLTATTVAGATYSWTGPNNFTSSQQNPTRTPISTADAGNYSVIATVNGCSSVTAVTYVAITSLTPTPVASNNGPLCPGQNLQLTASAIAGATYAWTGPNGFSSALQNPTLSNVAAADAGLYSVTATTSGCGTSAQGTTTLVVNTLPGAPTVGNNGPLCEGQTLSLTASNITGAAYQWSGPNGFSSNQQNPTVSNMNASKAGQYSVFVTVSGCGTSPAANTTVVTHAVPAIPTATSNGPVCAGDSLRLYAIAGGVGPTATFSWTGPNSFNSSLKEPVLGNSSTANAGNYQLTVSDSGCTSPAASTNVNVKSIPSAPVPSSNSPICEGGNLLLNASAVPGATYSWTGPNSYTSGVQNPLFLSATADKSGTYAVQAVVNGCRSIPASVTVLVNALPATPVVSNTGPKCVGDDINLSASAVPGATYSWTGPGGFSSSLQNPVLTNVTTGMSGIYNVIAISSTCSSLPGSTAVQVNTYPAAPTLSSSPTGTACTGDSLQLFATYVSGATYDWTGPAGFGSSSQNPVVHNLALANSGTYSATITKSGCISTASTISITVNETPATGPITGESPVKNFETKTYTTSGSPGSVFNWVIVGGTQQSGGTTNSITVAWGAASTTALVKMRETAASGCRGPIQQLPVTILTTVGVQESALQNGSVKLYPNPAGRIMNLEFALQQTTSVTVEWVNMLGQTLLSRSFTVAPGDVLPQDISSLGAGVYHVKVKTGSGQSVLRLTVE